MGAKVQAVWKAAMYTVSSLLENSCMWSHIISIVSTCDLCNLAMHVLYMSILAMN